MVCKKKASIDENSCVACGCCVNVCPKAAIKIIGGMYAVVKQSFCVGCGKCKTVCPASVIKVLEVVK